MGCNLGLGAEHAERAGIEAQPRRAVPVGDGDVPAGVARVVQVGEAEQRVPGRVLFLATVALLAATISVGAQRYAVPRTPWGHPDLQGRWTNATLTPLERPVELGRPIGVIQALAPSVGALLITSFGGQATLSQVTDAVCAKLES
mgnify:CR=1 FL=1